MVAEVQVVQLLLQVTHVLVIVLRKEAVGQEATQEMAEELTYW